MLSRWAGSPLPEISGMRRRQRISTRWTRSSTGRPSWAPIARSRTRAAGTRRRRPPSSITPVGSSASCGSRDRAPTSPRSHGVGLPRCGWTRSSRFARARRCTTRRWSSTCGAARSGPTSHARRSRRCCTRSWAPPTSTTPTPTRSSLCPRRPTVACSPRRPSAWTRSGSTTSVRASTCRSGSQSSSTSIRPPVPSCSSATAS